MANVLERFMADHKIARSLANVALLRSVPEALRQDIEARCRWAFHAEGSFLLAEEDESRDLAFLCHGRARIIQYTASGRAIAHAEIGPGSHFGELAAIDNQPRSASVLAVTDVVTASLTQPVMMELVKRSPDFAVALMRSLTGMIRGTNARLRNMSSLSARQRVAVELERLARSLRTGGSRRVTLIPAPTASEIAHRAATTRETVARTLGELRRLGVISTKRGSLDVDLEGLEDAMEGLGAPS